MTARVGRALSVALAGLTPHPVEVTAEVDGLPGLRIAGLSESRARECSIRVRSALAQLGSSGPGSADAAVSITGPGAAHAGGAVDLAVAVAVLAARGSCDRDRAEGPVFWGELSLSGELRPARGLLAALDLDRGVPEHAGARWIVPVRGTYEEVGRLGWPVRRRVLSAGNLSDVLDWIRGCGDRIVGPVALPPERPEEPFEPDPIPRALVAPLRAAFAHLEAGRGVLLVGPPGSGKTMLARRLARLLGPLGGAALRVSDRVCSVAGMPRDPRSRVRPFRAPHHTVSEAGLVGGGDPARPGEVSLAHGGVLFLDEVLEFRRTAIERVAAARRDGLVRLWCGGREAVFPAGCALVAASNLCPCGRPVAEVRGELRCACSPEALLRWRARLGEVRQRLGGLEVVEMPALDVAGMRDVVDVSRGLPREEEVPNG